MKRSMSFRLRSEEARDGGRKNGFVKICAYIAGTILIGFIVFSIVSTNIKINESKKQYNDLVAQTNTVLEDNASIERYLGEDANMDEYIEEIARDKLDFATPDERVYYIVPSSE